MGFRKSMKVAFKKLFCCFGEKDDEKEYVPNVFGIEEDDFKAKFEDDFFPWEK